MAKKILNDGDYYEEIEEPEEMPEQVTQKEIELTLKDGSVIKASSWEEAVKTAAKMKEDTAEALKQERAEREALRQQLEAMQSQIAQAQQPKAEPGSFDKSKYFELLNNDPLMAQNYVDAYRFGLGDPSQVPAYFSNMANSISVVEGQMLAGQFLQRHDDFPQDPESARAVREQFQTLQRQGYPQTVETMDMAYQQLVTAGRIKPIEQPDEQPDMPNPSLSGSGSVINDTELAKAESMSNEELEKLLRSKGLL